MSTVTITAPSNVYAPSSFYVTVMIVEDGERFLSGTLVYTITYGSQSNTVLLSNSLAVGENRVKVTLASEVEWKYIQFEARIMYPGGSQRYTAYSQPVQIIRNSPATATFNINGVVPGGEARIRWYFNESNVTVNSLKRFYKASSSSTWVTKNISVASTAVYADDYIPSDYDNGELYYQLTYTDANGLESQAETEHFIMTVVTPPSTPAQISYPSVVAVSQGASTTVRVSWSASESSNISGYQVEREYDKSGTWVSIYNNASKTQLYTDNAVEYGHAYVRYRVRAFYDGGSSTQYSDWRIGEYAAVREQLPAPTSINVPTIISSGMSIVISWSAVTDPNPEPTAVTYKIQRQVNGGSWTDLASQRTATNYTDTVGNDWNIVRYRVCAVDGYGMASAYRTSATRTVSQNHPPVISCEYSNNENLGVKNDRFSFTYSIIDVDASDSLTVTEYVDGVAFNTFAAVRGTDYTYNFGSQARWDNLVNGTHTIKISVSDTKVTVSLNLTFSKVKSGIYVELTNPIVTVEDITYTVLSISFTLPYTVMPDIPQGGINVTQFQTAFHNIDVTTVDGDSAWESCLMDTSQTIETAGQFLKQGYNLWIVLREGNLILLHKMTGTGNKFRYRILADTDDVDDLGHLCSVQGTFMFDNLTMPSLT